MLRSYRILVYIYHGSSTIITLTDKGPIHKFSEVLTTKLTYPGIYFVYSIMAHPILNDLAQELHFSKC